MEGDLKNGVVQYYLDPFQSTPSAWRVTWYILLTDQDGDISIHTLRMEGDSNLPVLAKVRDTFQSTPSAWRVTMDIILIGLENGFQSTPSAWRVTAAQAFSISL